MTTKPLDVLVGRFIHHCGGLELLANGAIMALSSDAVLASEATRAPLARRISLLRRLLADRTDLPEEDVKSLCDELDEIRVKRNLVAHNPIASKEPHADAPQAIRRNGSRGHAQLVLGDSVAPILRWSATS
jgi:hypothetical protein